MIASFACSAFTSIFLLISINLLLLYLNQGNDAGSLEKIMFLFFFEVIAELQSKHAYWIVSFIDYLKMTSILSSVASVNPVNRNQDLALFFIKWNNQGENRNLRIMTLIQPLSGFHMLLFDDSIPYEMMGLKAK